MLQRRVLCERRDVLRRNVLCERQCLLWRHVLPRGMLQRPGLQDSPGPHLLPNGPYVL